jgi:hypothetical protein
MLPPNRLCKPPKKFPTIERERTVMPRTTPKLRTSLKPGNSNAVVTMESLSASTWLFGCGGEEL